VPCTQASDCGTTGVHTCDTIVQAVLDDATEFLEDVGLYRASDDAGACTQSGFTFAERFFSKIVNQAADFFKVTSSLSSLQYHQLAFCDIGPFLRDYFPTDSPTPIPQGKCQNTTLIPASYVCDGTPQCEFGEDESAQCNCGAGYYYNGNNRCCSVCTDDDECEGSPFAYGGSYCGIPYASSSGIELCHSDVDGVVVCDPLKSSPGVTGVQPNPSLKSVKNSGSNNHIMGWADCTGSFQIGNPEEIAVAYGVHPFHQVATRLETVIQEMITCRYDKNTDPKFLQKQFYLWGTTMFGGVFFDTLTATTPPHYNGTTPGAKLDATFRWYSSAEERNYSGGNGEYIVSPPFANLFNQWTSCSLDSITGATRSCGAVADVASWFAGTAFPASWSTATTKLALYVASSCTDSFPNAYLECRGECDSDDPAAKPDSGCCVLRHPFVVPPAGSACPLGYKKQALNASITDFVFADGTPVTSEDTTLVNFLRLLAKRKYNFDADLPLVSPGLGADRTICLIDGDGWGDNVENWANKTFTEKCPAPFTTANGLKGCPQVLATSYIKACGGTNLDPCAALPTSTSCPVTGCPSTPETCVNGVCSPAALVAPSALGLAMLIFAFN
jgi:hypothetical protein